MRIEAAAHDDQSLRQFGEMRVERNGEGDIGQRPRGIYGHLVRVGVHLPYHEMRRVFGDRLGVRRALEHRWSFPGSERRCRSGRLDQPGRRG